MRAVIDHRKGDVVVTTETATLAWQDVTDDDSVETDESIEDEGESVEEDKTPEPLMDADDTEDTEEDGAAVTSADEGTRTTEASEAE